MRCGVLAIVLCAAGCGFQLRGQATLPPEMRVVLIQGQPSALSRALRSALVSNGATVTTDPAQSTAIIVLSHENNGRNTVAADRFDVKRQYRLAYAAHYQVTLPGGKTLIPEEGLSVNRSLIYDETRVLGFEGAQSSLVESMAEEMAWHIIRRLQAVKS